MGYGDYNGVSRGTKVDLLSQKGLQVRGSGGDYTSLHRPY